VLRAFRRALESDSVEVVEAASAEQGLTLIASGGFDAVVTDLMMPRMSGLELVAKVHAIEPDLPVVLVTGTPTVTSAARALSDGALRYLVKPVEPQELRATVELAVRQYRHSVNARQVAQRMSNPALLRRPAELDELLDQSLEALWMAFQPIVAAGGQGRFGYEALLRSQVPDMPHAGAILDVAERLGRLDAVARAVRAHVAAWIPRADLRDVFFVNLHPADLEDEDLLDRDAPLSGFAGRVVLEITERAALTNVDSLAERMASLRAMGFRIAIDDLGAGYAGLTSLVQLAPEVVKIDMSLVRGVVSHPVKRRIISSLSEVCHDIGSIVVAEGVENAPERDALVEIGCDLLQGYLFGRPERPFIAAQWG
jgi:EAL domain-containing protein (putative c-di-GMP-specific phosphodiesterase class I)